MLFLVPLLWHRPCRARILQQLAPLVTHAFQSRSLDRSPHALREHDLRLIQQRSCYFPGALVASAPPLDDRGVRIAFGAEAEVIVKAGRVLVREVHQEVSGALCPRRSRRRWLGRVAVSPRCPCLLCVPSFWPFARVAHRVSEGFARRCCLLPGEGDDSSRMYALTVRVRTLPGFQRLAVPAAYDRRHGGPEFCGAALGLLEATHRHCEAESQVLYLDLPGQQVVDARHHLVSKDRLVAVVGSLSHRHRCFRISHIGYPQLVVLRLRSFARPSRCAPSSGCFLGCSFSISWRGARPLPVDLL